VNLAVHFIRARSNLILSCSSGLFISFYITLVEVVERKKRIMDGEEGGNGENRSVFKSLLLNRENGFPYFIYVVAYLYLNC